MRINRNCLAVLSAAMMVALLGTACEVPPTRERVVTPDVRFEQGVQVVEVVLDDHVIHMPLTLEEGETRFLIRNEGEARHTFGIRNDRREWVLEPALEPGEEGELRASLLPGDYEVWCPVGMHAMLGMRETVSVMRRR